MKMNGKKLTGEKQTGVSHTIYYDQDLIQLDL